jgi:UDP-glucose 4-epimerase
VARYFPRYPELYTRRGWTMFDSIDRVYDPSRAAARLGFVCETTFADVLRALDAEA